MRYYIGVDWADEEHAVWVEDEQGQRVTSRLVPHTAAGFSEWGHELNAWRAQGIGLWAGIEREAVRSLKAAAKLPDRKRVRPSKR